MKIDWNDPIGCIDSRMFKIKEEHGIWPEVVELTEEAFTTLWNHSEVQCRIRYQIWGDTTPAEYLAAICRPPGDHGHPYEQHFEFRVSHDRSIECSFETLGGQLL